MKIIACALSLLTAGCIPLGHNNHLVLGLGMFHVDQTNQVSVVKVNSLGAYVGDGRLNLGISKTISVSIPTNSNTILELNSR